jgi:protein gp37
MTDRSAIEWTQATWNPVTGCDRISPGCQHCYALTLATRLKAMGQAKYQTDGDPRTSGSGFGVAIHPHALLEPLGWRRPRRIFVCSMADLFHARVPEAFIAQVFAVMATAGHHTYQVLTKRPLRMEHLLSSDAFAEQVFQHATSYGVGSLTWPLPNVWLGTSVEDQPRADQRVPKLLSTPAAIRFLSCEPLLGPVELAPEWMELKLQVFASQGAVCFPRVDWIIVGGESGPGHRPVDPAWVRSLRDQALAAGVAFFFKQWGGRTPGAGGRLLDGRTWDLYPREDRGQEGGQ